MHHNCLMWLSYLLIYEFLPLSFSFLAFFVVFFSAVHKNWVICSTLTHVVRVLLISSPWCYLICSSISHISENSYFDIEAWSDPILWEDNLIGCTVDPWTTQGFGTPALHTVENRHITSQPALQILSSTFANSTNLRLCSIIVCIYWKNFVYKWPVQFKPM